MILTFIKNSTVLDKSVILLSSSFHICNLGIPPSQGRGEMVRGFNEMVNVKGLLF